MSNSKFNPSTTLRIDGERSRTIKTQNSKFEKGFTPHLWKISTLISFFFKKMSLFTSSIIGKIDFVGGRAVIKKRNLPRVAGFSTIEILVAMLIFVVLISIAASSFINSLRTQKTIASLIEANNNVSLALEQMAREMRTGLNFQKPSGSEIQFINAYGSTVHYRLNGNSIERGVESVTGLNYEKITAQNAQITSFSAVILDSSVVPGYPPRITISLTVSATNSYIQGISTTVQTTVTSRNT